VTRIKGPGVVSARPKPSSLVGAQPTISLDRLLRHVGEDGIGAAEGDHGELGKEDGYVGEDVIAPKQKHEERLSASQRPAVRKVSVGHTGLVSGSEIA